LPPRITLLSGNRQEGESRKAMIACNDFLRLGSGRSLPLLLKQYRDSQLKAAPTQSINTLQKWSKNYLWRDRAEEYDVDLERQKNETAAARRREILESGLALDYERVATLKETAEYLIEQIREISIEGTRDRVWLRDVKQIGSGEDAERVDIVRFNGSLFEQLRGALDDLAQETGGRVRKQEVSGKDGKPIQAEVAFDLSKLSTEQLIELAKNIPE